MRLLLVFVATVCAVAAGARGQCHPERIATLVGSVSDLELSGDLAFVAARRGGMKVIDVSDPTSLTLISSCDVPSFVTGLALDGDYAYLADRRGFLVVDVSDPTAPVEVALLELSDTPYEILLTGDVAIVRLYEGIRLLDVSDPTDPMFLGTYDVVFDSISSMHIDGDLLYLGRRAPMVEVLDISEPVSPALIGSLDLDDTPNGMDVQDGVLYIAGDDVGFFIADVSDPSQPVLTDTLLIAPDVNDVKVVGETAYLALSGGFYIVDLAVLPDLKVIGFNFSFSGDITLAGDLMYLAGGSVGLQVVDIADPTTPTLIERLRFPNDVYGVDVHDGVAYLADGLSASAFISIDVSDPSSPHPLDSIEYAFGIGRIEQVDLDVDRNLAYLIDSQSGYRVIDISDPSSLKAVATSPCTCRHIAHAGTVLYHLTYQGVLSSVDLTDPTSPVPLDDVDVQDGHGLAIADGYAYIAAESAGLKIVDIQDPSSLEVVGSLNINSDVIDVDVDGSYAYLAVTPPGADVLGEQGLYVVDVSDPAHPTLAATVNTPIARRHQDDNADVSGVDVRAGLAFLYGAWRDTLVYDVGDPTSPVYVATIERRQFLSEVAFEGENAFFAERNAGLQVVDLSTCPCAADINGDGDLTVLDFIAFQLAWTAQEPAADCDGDGDHDITDVTCFQTLFARGCG